MLEVKFKKSEIIFSIILCLLGLTFSIFFLFRSYLPVKIICIIWAPVILIILSERISQLKRSRSQNFALKFDEKGITNATVLNGIFIPWDEIKAFQTGFYRTRSIFIDVDNPARYKTTKVKDYMSLIGYLNDLTGIKPYLLWIDIEILNITKDELMALWRKHKK